jgi:hypothetical protein
VLVVVEAALNTGRRPEVERVEITLMTHEQEKDVGELIASTTFLFGHKKAVCFTKNHTTPV